MKKKKGFFITFEGGEGVGKTTQIKLLEQAFRDNAFDVTVTREPGGTPLSEEIRGVLLQSRDESPDPKTEVGLHMAARNEHLKKVIKPALDDGGIVISDRFVDSNMAYQGYGMGVDRSMIQNYYDMISDGVKPDLTIVFDYEVEAGLKRALERNDEATDQPDESRYEKIGQSFHEKVRDGFMDIAKNNPDRCVVIQSHRPDLSVNEAISAIHTEIVSTVKQRLGVSLR